MQQNTKWITRHRKIPSYLSVNHSKATLQKRKLLGNSSCAGKLVLKSQIIYSWLPYGCHVAVLGHIWNPKPHFFPDRVWPPWNKRSVGTCPRPALTGDNGSRGISIAKQEKQWNSVCSSYQTNHSMFYPESKVCIFVGWGVEDVDHTKILLSVCPKIPVKHRWLRVEQDERPSKHAILSCSKHEMLDVCFK